MKGSDNFTQEQVVRISNNLTDIVNDLLGSIEKSFRSQSTSIDNNIGDNKVNAYCGGGTFQGLNRPVLYISYLISWYSPKSLK